MATPERAEPTRDHVSMSELLASCAAARALSTPPRRQPERRDEEFEGYEEPAERAGQAGRNGQVLRGEAA